MAKIDPKAMTRLKSQVDLTKAKAAKKKAVAIKKAKAAKAKAQKLKAVGYNYRRSKDA